MPGYPTLRVYRSKRLGSKVGGGKKRGVIVEGA
jgi:hypothetical protein